MIIVQDNYLETNGFASLQEYCNSTEFQIMKAGEKEFYVLPVPENILPHLRVEGYDIILTFIRQAHKGFDTDLRIHADNIIQGHKVDLATVLYINDNEGVSENGTCFWEHDTHGYTLNEDVTNEEFDRLLTEDANDPSKWRKTDYIAARPNRILTYGAQQFHSKWPAKIEEGKRIVLVCFYKKS